MSVDYSGRLELTWTIKDKTLLAHEDGTYEWVDPSDYRVAEVRLLHDVATFGDANALPRRAMDNLLIRGDALHALHTLNHLPCLRKDTGNGDVASTGKPGRATLTRRVMPVGAC